MKIQLLCIGRTREKDIADAIERYARRIPFYMPFEMICLPDVRTTRATTPERQKDAEGEQILAQIHPSDFVMLLDERGREMTSRQWSEFIERKAVELPRNLILVIGGPYGFSQAVYSRANAMLGLSKMTFPHELVRLFIVEQIYRAMTIMRGEPYHHD